jgi:hypothetical protein
MLDKKTILGLFDALNSLLSKNGEIGEVGIVGGTVMCLIYDARASTRDVDAIFKPAALIRKLAAQIGEEHQIEATWLNDGAKAYLTEGFKRVDVLNLSHLRVWAPEPRYMLAMKCLSARWDTLDRKDVQFLIGFLKLKKKTEVFRIIEHYYPKARIPAKTQFFIEELMEKMKG